MTLFRAIGPFLTQKNRTNIRILLAFYILIWYNIVHCCVVEAFGIGSESKSK